ncbi:MAG TPA: c-type cytochrome [Alphaproteobacteria bacterium]|nr:c-type cytochrome [Alphaproteobacteria bacterium]
MDSFEFNKIAGAVLMTALVATVIGHIGDILVPEAEGGKTHIEIAGVPAPGTPTQVASVPTVPFDQLLATASAKSGEADAKVCETCHNFVEGKGPKIGPDLYGVVGRKIASNAKFEYSDAIKKLPGDWTFDKLNDWIAGPQKVAPGTKMTFAGIPDAKKRADVIAYLDTLSAKPEPLPKPAPVAPAAAKPVQAAAAPSFDQILAGANAKQGAQDAKVCEICHNFVEGKGPKIGPDLYGVVGRKIASNAKFEYSDAIKKLPGDWTFDKLDQWIAGPQKVAPGTKMTFAGVPDEKKRADIIAFLDSLSKAPVPLPAKK